LIDGATTTTKAKAKNCNNHGVYFVKTLKTEVADNVISKVNKQEYDNQNLVFLVPIVMR
jgi:hypothetical protein